MGSFKIEIVAGGGHGCQRDKKDGETVFGCRNMSCPDCIAREFVIFLKNKGFTLQSASFTHWPDAPGEVKDDLLSGIRKGNF